MDATSTSFIKKLFDPGGRELLVPFYSRQELDRNHFRLPMLHMVMDADLSQFKTIVLERPGQLWAGSSGSSWKNFCH